MVARERHRLTRDLGPSNAWEPWRDDPSGTIIGRFSEVAARHGGRPAILAGESAVTYGQLCLWSGRVSAAIARAGIPEGLPVGLLLTHGANAVAGMLGALGSTRPFVPADPHAPPGWNAVVMAEAGIGALVTDRAGSSLAETVVPDGTPVILVDRLPDDLPDGAAAADGDPEAPAIIVPTSGSTGRPKGVVWTQGGLLRHVRFTSESFRTGPDDRQALLLPYTGGAGLHDTLTALTSGACVIPFDLRSQPPSALAGLLRERRVTIVHMVPSLFRAFASSLPEGTPFPDLRILSLGGEAITRGDLDLFRRIASGDCLLRLGMGVTEACRTVLLVFMDRYTELPPGPVPMGYAHRGLEVTVEDAAGVEVRDGEEGEIVLAGRHLAGGYWGNPELTARVFSPDPDRPGVRRYRTGDLGMRRPDGLFVHLGRRDDLLKIGGARVSVAEVEGALLGVAGVTGAAVAPWDDGDGDRWLAGYVVTAVPGIPGDSDLLGALRRTLPPHMVPARIVRLAELPRLPGGKVDRRLLPRPAGGPRAAGGPTGEGSVAGRLRLLWEGILGRGDFGDDDLFFDIGGTSLKAVRLLSLVKREFGVDLPVSVLAEAGTIDRLAGVIAGGERAKGMLLPLRQGGALPPLFILPGGGTEPFRYRELAALIEPDRPVIGVRYPGWDGVTRPPRTMDGLARAIVDELLPLVGAGPLLIVGASFGGLVAFEVARRLQACGIPVGLLAILDTQAPGNPVPLPGLSPGRAVRRLLLRLQPIGARARPSRELIREGLAHRWARLVALPSITWRRLRGIPLQHEYRYLSVLDAAFRITYRCRLPRSPLRILLFRASVGPSADLFTVDPLLGWGEMAQGGVEVHEVPGTHGDVGVGATAPLVAGIINRGIAGGERG